jgi:predicted DNA-binding transcriptional regulator AlpA
MPSPETSELLPPERAAEETGVSLAAFWRGVAAGRLPAPVYPAPKAPRWYRHELHAALEATRALPREAMAARRAAKLAASRAA